MNLSQAGFLILLIIQIPSLYCIIHIFYGFTQRGSPLRHLKNHLLMCLLIVATWTIIIELPNTQKYLWTGSATFPTYGFCAFWNISFFSTSTLNRVLMTFMCIQRHFLVFHPQAYNTRRSRLLFHYIPLIFIISSILIYEVVTSIFLSCPGVYLNYSNFLCGYACGIRINSFATFFIWLFIFVPTVVTTVGCALLPIRFVIQKRQLQRLQWRRARKMIIQTSVIASVYTLCWLPYTIILQLVLNNVLSLLNPDIGRYFSIIPYMTSLLTPFIIFHTIRRQVNLGIMERIKRRFFPQRQGVVQPVNNFVGQQQNLSAFNNGTSTRQLRVIKNT